MKSLAFVGTHGGGDSALVAYNLAWMYAESGFKVLCVDLTTAARLSLSFLDPTDLRAGWDGGRGFGLFGALSPLVEGAGAADLPLVETEHSGLARDIAVLKGAPLDATWDDTRRRLAIVPGDPALARFGEPFERAWLGPAPSGAAALEVLLACRRLIRARALQHHVSVVIVDLGSERTALTRAGLLAADASVTVTGPGATAPWARRTLDRLRSDWRARWGELAPGDDATGLADPLGSVHVEAAADGNGPAPDCLGRVRFVRSLGPMSREAHKPMFLLSPSDGAMGGHAAAVFDARQEWQALARAIAGRAGVEWPTESR